MSNEPSPASQPPELHPIFPGRTKLYLIEVAKILNIPNHAVVALIAEYCETGGKSGIRAWSILESRWQIAGQVIDGKVLKKTPPACLRIEISAFDAYVELQKSKGINPLADFEAAAQSLKAARGANPSA